MSLEKEIENMKIKCKRRIQQFAGVLCICSALISMQVINLAMPFARVSEHYADMLEGVQYGFIIGLVFVSVFFIIYYSKAIRNNELARKLYIKENDERNKLIKEKSGVRFYLINVICLAVGVVVSGYFNHIVFFTLIAVIYFQIFIIGITKIYWKHKL